MEYDWNVGWDSISQIAVSVYGPSVLSSVMTMISYLSVFGVKRFVTNVMPTRFLITNPLIVS